MVADPCAFQYPEHFVHPSNIYEGLISRILVTLSFVSLLWLFMLPVLFLQCAARVYIRKRHKASSKCKTDLSYPVRKDCFVWSFWT